MKKGFIRKSIIIATISAVLTGCGQNRGIDILDNKNDTDVINTEDAATAVNIKEAELSPSDELLSGDEKNIGEAQDTSGYSPEDITISSPGEYEITFQGYDEDDNYIGDFKAKINVEITEATEGLNEGEKKVTAVFNMDLSDNPGPVYWNFVSAFDYYTGISFECASEKNNYSADESLALLGLGSIDIGSDGRECNISMTISTDNNYPDMTDTVEVWCPEDYDGTTFQIGYITGDELTELQTIDFTDRLIAIDELPNYKEEALYFRIK